MLDPVLSYIHLIFLLLIHCGIKDWNIVNQPLKISAQEDCAINITCCLASILHKMILKMFTQPPIARC